MPRSMAPTPPLPPTTFTSRRRALVAAALCGGAMIALGIGLVTGGGPPPPPERPDIDRDLYAGIHARLQAGVPYYQAVGAELRLREFPRWPVFNWRTPLHLQVVAAFP